MPKIKNKCIIEVNPKTGKVKFIGGVCRNRDIKKQLDQIKRKLG